MSAALLSGDLGRRGSGNHLTTTLTLTAGCVIAGRVVTHDGKPAGDGAIEKQWTGEADDLDFTWRAGSTPMAPSAGPPRKPASRCLELGGTGRIDGTTPKLTSGSFELLLGTCVNPTGTIPLPQSHRVITVTDGHFTVDDLPACELSFGTLWHGQRVPQHASIPSGGTAHVALDLGPPT